jgi:hypothetical protein
VLSRPVTITVNALTTMLRIHDVGALPAAIQPDPIWRDPVPDRAAEAAWREFTEVHLVGRTGRLNDNALDTLHMLARPSVQYIGVMLGNNYRDSVVVAARGDEAIVAYRAGDAVTLESCVRHQSLPETLLWQIPDARPAPIQAVNLRVDDLTALRNGDPFGAASPTAWDAGTLDYLKRKRLVGQGELYVAVRDAYGRRQISGPIRYQDYRVGRVTVVIDGSYLSVAPATKVLLRDRLRAAHRGLCG